MHPHPLTNFEIQNYYQIELNFMVFSQSIKDGAYIITLYEHESIGTHASAKKITYFDSFVVKRIPTEIRKIIGKKIL